VIRDSERRDEGEKEIRNESENARNRERMN
jgi:hypothetical protein